MAAPDCRILIESAHVEETVSCGRSAALGTLLVEDRNVRVERVSAADRLD